MTTLPGTRVKIPFGKIASFVASLVVKSKSGFSKEEGAEILADFLELFADVLTSNT